MVQINYQSVLKGTFRISFCEKGWEIFSQDMSYIFYLSAAITEAKKKFIWIYHCLIEG